MLKKLAQLLSRQRRLVSIKMRRGTYESVLECRVGDNLMDATNATVNQNANIFGLCDKQLACTTCRVDIETGLDRLPPPSQQQLDVLLTTKNYNPLTSRMACQVFITQQLDGMVVRVDPKGSGSK